MYAKELTYVKHWTTVHISTKPSTYDEILKAQCVVIEMGRNQPDPCY